MMVLTFSSTRGAVWDRAPKQMKREKEREMPLREVAEEEMEE